MKSTPAQVKDIMGIDLDDAKVAPYIKTANIFLTKAFQSVTVADDLWEEIETWLAAHYIALVRARISVKEEAGTAKIEYPNVFGANLSATPYGQTAMMMDTTGTLQELSQERKRAKLNVVKTIH